MDEVKKVTLFPRGPVRIPPSKSVSHRALICAGLSDGPCYIENLAFSKDIEATRRCMAELRRSLSEKIPSSMPLDCGESGSTLRFLIPLAALLPFETRFTGRGRLMERPLGPYFGELERHGARLGFGGGVLRVCGPLTPGVFDVPGDISSQFVTGLLFALPLLDGDSEIRIASRLESAPYVDLTLDMMERFGVAADKGGYRSFGVRGGQKYRACDIAIEADYSQAAFFLVAGALGCDCECVGLSSDSKQGDREIIGILKACGAKLAGTDSGGLAARPGRLVAQTVDVSDIPDLVPPLAALLCFCEGTSRITNAGRLRHKESDRLAAVAEELNGLGANIAVDGDSLSITGVKALRGGRMSSRGDHRIAMMGAVAAIRSEGPVCIEGADCVAKSYPGFWRDFEKEQRI